MVEVGGKAPDFALYDTQGKEHRLSEYRGKNVVLFFFVKAFTGTCERQVSDHDHAIDQFKGLNAQILGVSTDQSPAQAELLKGCGVSSYPVLSDFRHQVVNQYGIALATGQRANERATFIIDRDGVLRHRYVEPDPSKWAGLDPEIQVLKGLQR